MQKKFEIQNVEADWKEVQKEEVKNEHNACPDCGSLASPIAGYGRELFPNSRYSAAEHYYNICSECKYVYSYTL